MLLRTGAQRCIRGPDRSADRAGLPEPAGVRGTSMRQSKYSEAQSTCAVRRAEVRMPVGDACRQLGLSEASPPRLSDEDRACGPAPSGCGRRIACGGHSDCGCATSPRPVRASAICASVRCSAERACSSAVPLPCTESQILYAWRLRRVSEPTTGIRCPGSGHWLAHLSTVTTSG